MTSDKYNSSFELRYNENDFNATEEEYLNEVLGPKYLPQSMVIPMTTIYVTIFVFGIFGNVTTCIVIVRNAMMQTATNYYLFSLAISDLTLLVLGLPNELSVFWQQYPWTLGVTLCKIRAYVSEVSSYVSVLTIVAFSTERYFAICHPLRVYALSGLKRPIRFILVAWSIALISAIPFAIYTKVNLVEYPPGSGNYSTDSAICAMLLPNMPKFPLYEMSCIVFFLVPMVIISVAYIRMGLKIKRSTVEKLGSNVEGMVHGDSRQMQSRKSVVRMLSAVVILFFFCWAPFHAQRLLYIYGQDSDYYPDLNEWLYIFSGCLYYFSTTINPILYNLMSAKYREAFKQVVCCKMKSRKKWNVTESHLCRYTINQAKEVFRFTSNQERIDKNGNTNNCKKSYTLKEDSKLTPLLVNNHVVAHEQISSESTTSKETEEKSISTVNTMNRDGKRLRSQRFPFRNCTSDDTL